MLSAAVCAAAAAAAAAAVKLTPELNTRLAVGVKYFMGMRIHELFS